MQDIDQIQDPHSIPAHQQHMQEDKEVLVSTPQDAAAQSSEIQFYRTCYKPSEQQIALPKGLYRMRPGASLAVQLYVAVHPQDWDGDAYVAQRAARLQQLAHPQAPAGKPGHSAEEAAAPTPDKAAAAAAPTTADGSSSPHQGSCSPPCISSPSNTTEPATAPQHAAAGNPTSTQAGWGSSSSLEALAAAAVAACQLQLQEEPAASSPVPEPQQEQQQDQQQQQQQQQDQQQQQQQDHHQQQQQDQQQQDHHQQQQQQADSAAETSPAEAEAQSLLWSEAAAAGWSQGFSAGSQLLGPFRAQARALTGSREGMCRLSRVQHDGKLKGVLHNTNHRAVLYERVGVTLLLHLQPRMPGDNSSGDGGSSSSRRGRAAVRLYSKSLGQQVYPGTVTEVEMAARLCCTASGTIPIKLPKAFVLSQFSGVAAGSLPLVVPLDVLVDGQPAELTMQVQGPNSSSSSSIRVQREVQISQLPRHQAYCLTGLATAGLGAYTGFLVTRISAPAGERIVLHLTSPAAQAAAAADSAATAADCAAAAAPRGEGEDEGATAGVQGEDGGSSSDGQASEAPAEGLPECSQLSTDTAAAAVAVAQPACAGSSSQAATVGHRGFLLQRLTRTQLVPALPAAASTAAAPAAANKQTLPQQQQQGGGSSAEKSRHPGAAAAAVAVLKAPAPVTAAPGGSKASSNRLEMFRAILERQRQQQQQQQEQQEQQKGAVQQCTGRAAPGVDEKVGPAAPSVDDSSLNTANSSSSASTESTATCGTSAPQGGAAAAPAAVGAQEVSGRADHPSRQLKQQVVGGRGSKRSAQKSRLGEQRQQSTSSTGSGGGTDAVAAVVVSSNKRQKRGGMTT